MNNDDKPIANPFVMLREEFDDWAILFDPDTGHGFGLSPTGAFVWKLLDGEHSINALLEVVQSHAENASEEVGEHIGEFLDALVPEGLAGFDSNKCGFFQPDSAPAQRKNLPPILLAMQARLDRSGMSTPN